MALQVSLSIPFERIPETVAEIQALFPDYVEGDPQPEYATTYPQSYARILYIRAQAAESFICVCWYTDQAAREQGEAPIKVQEVQVATTALVGDIYPAAYAYLKTLPEFAGAIDC